jgi:hypothetical protein
VATAAIDTEVLDAVEDRVHTPDSWARALALHVIQHARDHPSETTINLPITVKPRKAGAAEDFVFELSICAPFGLGCFCIHIRD